MKFLIVLSTIAIATLAAPHGDFTPPTSEQVKAEMVAAGISDGAADGIIKIGEAHKAEFQAADGNKEAAKAAFEVVKTEVDTYMKGQSEADQTAYNAFIEKKKADFEAHKAEFEAKAGATA